LFDVTDRFRLHFNYCTATISREREENERKWEREGKKASIHSFSLVLSRFALEKKRESKDTNDCSMYHHHYYYYRCCTTTKTQHNAAFI
jgi:hypothetical protein